jgi:hypothetical protein
MLLSAGCADLREKTAAVLKDMEPRTRQARFENSIPECDGEADCAAKWEAARRWVKHNVGLILWTTSTPDVIRMYTPEMKVTVTKEPTGSEKFRIVMSIACYLSLGSCNGWGVAPPIEFNKAVGHVTPQAARVVQYARPIASS